MILLERTAITRGALDTIFKKKTLWIHLILIQNQIRRLYVLLTNYAGLLACKLTCKQERKNVFQRIKMLGHRMHLFC